MDVLKYIVAVGEGQRLVDAAERRFEEATDATSRWEEAGRQHKLKWWRELDHARDVVDGLLKEAQLLPISSSCGMDLLQRWGIVCSTAWVPGSTCSTVDDGFILRHTTGYSSHEDWRDTPYCSVAATDCMSLRISTDLQYILTDFHGCAAPA